MRKWHLSLIRSQILRLSRFYTYRSRLWSRTRVYDMNYPAFATGYCVISSYLCLQECGWNVLLPWYYFRSLLHALAYNLFNWFRRLALAANMRKLRIDTVRLKLMKIAARAVHSARYTTFKLCSSSPYKDEFYETLQNIRGLQPQLE